MSGPVGWIKDTSLIALKRDESTVMAYPHDYLIRPAVPLYTADAIREAVEAERERCCGIIYGMCESDNVAQRTVDAIKGGAA